MQVNPGLVTGEDVVTIPEETYEQGHEALADYLENVAGRPKRSSRCVEVDVDGYVVAVCSADPYLDRPVRHPSNTLELHGWASVGDRKVNGRFPDRPVPAPDVLQLGINK